MRKSALLEGLLIAVVLGGKLRFNMLTLTRFGRHD